MAALFYVEITVDQTAPARNTIDARSCAANHDTPMPRSFAPIGG